MPFYISFDSADVWSNPALFRIDEKGAITGMAGVPPDYFSKTGQLWGMPVYNWDKLKATNYDWWVKRIKRNLDFFDIIRLDHFRAFAAYWEVPAGSKDATTGKWKPGPGADFFGHIRNELGALPFVAEDLGDIDDAVYNLRDEFGLPGMRVLQFAFDEAMAVSEYAPHNYIENTVAYTGTHDNNTVAGWFKSDADNAVKKRLKNYYGGKITAKNISDIMIRMCYGSVAKTAIIPLQDILSLGANSRMNVPSVAKGNWEWMVDGKMLSPKIEKKLKNLTICYNR